jgi:primosomal protein N' (replication factor Y)
MPEQPVMRALAAGDRDGFLHAESESRRAAGLPPFGRLAALIVSAGDGEAADFAARALARAAPQLPGIAVLGPAPAPLGRLRGEYRAQLLVKGTNRKRIREALRAAIAPRPELQRRVIVDIDPLSVL